MKRIIDGVARRLISKRAAIHMNEADLLTRRKGFVTRRTPAGEVEALLGKLAPIAREGLDLIRLGPDSDGGYLVPDDLAEIEACFSPGVGPVSGFEKDCANRGMKVFMADNSVDSPAEDHPSFNFEQKFIGSISNDAFMTMDHWVDTSIPGSESDLVLQIDTGDEYEIFLNMSDRLLSRFRIIVAEFHGLDQFWNHDVFRLASRAFDRIFQTHACVHIHPNSCCGSFEFGGLDIPRVAEFTFLRLDRISGAPCASVLPHPLDRANTHKPPVALGSLAPAGHPTSSKSSTQAQAGERSKFHST